MGLCELCSGNIVCIKVLVYDYSAGHVCVCVYVCVCVCVCVCDACGERMCVECL